MTQLKAKYGEESIQALMVALRDARFGQQFVMMATRLCNRPNITVGQCDKMIVKLQDAIVTVNAKKAELQGS